MYRGAGAVLLCLDLSCSWSWENLPGWISEIRGASEGSVPIVIVGCKCDLRLKRAVAEEKVVQFANFYNMSYVETSAKEDINIHETMKLAVHDAVSAMQGSELDCGINSDLHTSLDRYCNVNRIRDELAVTFLCIHAFCDVRVALLPVEIVQIIVQFLRGVDGNFQIGPGVWGCECSPMHMRRTALEQRPPSRWCLIA